MKFDKEHVEGLFLVGIGVAAFYFLLKKSSLPQPDTQNQPEQAGNLLQPVQLQSPSYPNAGIDPSTGVSIGGSPLTITYNYPETRAPKPPAKGTTQESQDKTVYPNIAPLDSSLHASTDIPQTFIEASFENLRSIGQTTGGKLGII